jgi:hypothetical protein
MSDLTLRKALERELDGGLHGMRYDLNGYPTLALPKARLLDLLALHPAEPVPVVTDEAVDALAHVLFDREWVPGDWRWEQYPEPNRWQEVARKGLEAAAPLLGPGRFWTGRRSRASSAMCEPCPGMERSPRTSTPSW